MQRIHSNAGPGAAVARTLLALFVAAGLPTPATAGGDAERHAAGRQFAERNCARCHAVGRSGDSPHRAAPPFRVLAARWPLENIEEALAEGIVSGHPDMPEFRLTPERIRELIGYLNSIQRR